MHALFGEPRKSPTPGPRNMGGKDVVSLLSGSKKSPTEADYKPASDDSKKRCHECMNYGKPGESEADCGVVIGIVKAEGICDMFAQRDYQEPKSGGVEIVVRL